MRAKRWSSEAAQVHPESKSGTKGVFEHTGGLSTISYTNNAVRSPCAVFWCPLSNPLLNSSSGHPAMCGATPRSHVLILHLAFLLIWLLAWGATTLPLHQHHPPPCLVGAGTEELGLGFPKGSTLVGWTPSMIQTHLTLLRSGMKIVYHPSSSSQCLP